MRLIDADALMKKAIETFYTTNYFSHITKMIDDAPTVEQLAGWDIVKTMLKELEQKEERLLSDYCDATARLKAISKIAKSDQKPKQKIEGIWPLAEQLDELLKEYPEIKIGGRPCITQE